MGAKLVKASCVSTLPRSEVLREGPEIDVYLEEAGPFSYRVDPLIAEDVRREASLALCLVACATREGYSLAPEEKDGVELRRCHGESIG